MNAPTVAALRAAIEQAYGVSRSHFAYARWLRDQGYLGRAGQVYREGSRANARGLGLELELEALQEAQGG